MKDQEEGLKINLYLEKLNEKLKNEGDSFFYAFRGLPSIDYHISCTAVRNDESQDLSQTDLLDNQKKLINDVRSKGSDYSKEKSKKLNDLELLADLRHYGAPSCLIDFTSDFLIALWFACQKNEQGNEGKDGKVFVLNCYDTSKFLNASAKLLDPEIKIDEFISDESDHIWYWVPERLNQRLTDQDAIFIFGNPTIPEKEGFSVCIAKKDKEHILYELEKFFDYSQETLFSDKYAIGEYYKKTNLNSVKYLLENAIYYIQTNSIEKAKNILNTIIRGENNLSGKIENLLLLEALFQRAYIAMESVKKDFENSSGLKNDSLNNTNKSETRFETHNKDLPSINEPPPEDSEGYRKDIYYCLKNIYKVEKIKFLHDEFRKTIVGSMPPEPPDNTDL